jgi:chromosome segregation ATPase
MDHRAIELHDEALKLMPDGASHEESECTICVEKAALAEGGNNDEQSSSTEEAEEGIMSGTNTDTLSQETHDALLRTRVADATAALTADNEALTEQVGSLISERDEAAGKVSALEGEVARLNNELDTAQVELASASEKVTELESDIARRDEEAQLREVAQERAKQVRNLKLFADEAIDEKAERWAALSEEDWADRLEEWKGIQATNSGDQAGRVPAQETASTLTGTSEGQEEAAEKQSARRRVLGLAN